MPTEKEIEDKIKDFFDSNYEILYLESRHKITEDTKRTAFNQVLCYYRKLKDFAKSITETEVRLMLPDQITPKGRSYSIEGVVDIVKEKDEVCMYDIKTHDVEYIRGNLTFYEAQLNVYAYIWKKLRGNKLDKTAIISTAYPNSVKYALFNRDEEKLQKALDNWNPVVEIPFTVDKANDVIEEFGRVVDYIEEHEFSPPPDSRLEEKVEGTSRIFGRSVCANCDARFSCSSFCEYARRNSRTDYMKYFALFMNDLDEEEWINANLDASNGNEL